jgi:integrase
MAYIEAHQEAYQEAGSDHDEFRRLFPNCNAWLRRTAEQVAYLEAVRKIPRGKKWRAFCAEYGDGWNRVSVAIWARKTHPLLQPITGPRLLPAAEAQPAPQAITEPEPPVIQPKAPAAALQPIKKHRRPKGDGSIVQRKDGIWQYSIDLGKDAAGKRQRLHLYAGTKAALQRKITDERAHNGGSFKPRDKATIGEWVRTWLESKKANLAPNTYALYETAWRVNAKPLIESKRLDTFNADDVRSVYEALAKKGKGRMTQVVGKLMRAAFAQAEKEEKIRKNPWDLVDIPKHETKAPHALTEDEAQRFIQAARRDRYEALWLLCLYGGLRLGEALGLQWSDISFEDGTIKIDRQLTETNGLQTIGRLKTKSSYRAIVVGETALDALRRRQESAKGEGHQSSFVFTLPNGGHPKRKALDIACAKIATAAKIGNLHPHDLRHTHNSHKLAAGISPVVVAAGMGHSSTRMTLDRYGHQLPGQQAEAAAALEARFSK